MDLSRRPTLSFAFFKREISPHTQHTPETYVATQIPAEYVSAEVRRQGIGAVFRVPPAVRREIPSFAREDELRITAINENWVYAVPSTYDENFWE